MSAWTASLEDNQPGLGCSVSAHRDKDPLFRRIPPVMSAQSLRRAQVLTLRGALSTNGTGTTVIRRTRVRNWQGPV